MNNKLIFFTLLSVCVISTAMEKMVEDIVDNSKALILYKESFSLQGYMKNLIGKNNQLTDTTLKAYNQNKQLNKAVEIQSVIIEKLVKAQRGACLLGCLGGCLPLVGLLCTWHANGNFSVVDFNLYSGNFSTFNQ